jgi:RNA polymerase sigma-70 factor (ECF subfamily)
MNDPASEWMEAARRGDPDAAARLVDGFHARIYAFLRRLAGSDTNAVELTQRTFCRAWESLAGFAGRSSVSSWLHGIAYHVYVDWLRRERRNVVQSDEWWLTLADPGATPDRLVADADAAAVVYAAVDCLEPALRETIHLHYFQGLSIDETAEALGIATSTVKYRTRQALAELQKAVGQPRPRPSDRRSTPLPSPPLFPGTQQTPEKP